MRLKIISDLGSEYDTEFLVTDEVIPSVGDEVIWAYESSWLKKKGMLRGTVKKRTMDYAVAAVFITPARTYLPKVILEIEDVNPVFQE